MLYNTLRQYEYVVAVAEAGSLTDAAAMLHISQPSLSVAITRVEQQLGQAIFVRRKGAAIEITPFGYRLVEQARNLLRLATEIEKEPREPPPFVLGCFEDIAPWYLAPALETLRRRFPAMSLSGREGRFADLAADLAEGRSDIVISYDVGFEGKFERRKIRTVTPVAFLPTEHPLAKRPSVDLAELAAYPIILSTEALSEGFMRNLFNRLKLSPTVAHKATSLELMRSLAAHGSGIGISYSRPPGDVAYDGKPLTTVPISTPQAAVEIQLLWSALRAVDAQFDETLKALELLG